MIYPPLSYLADAVLSQAATIREQAGQIAAYQEIIEGERLVAASVEKRMEQHIAALQRDLAAAAEREREECAKVADNRPDDYSWESGPAGIAAAIRARGESLARSSSSEAKGGAESDG